MRLRILGCSGGISGGKVEGAWLSGQSLARAVVG